MSASIFNQRTFTAKHKKALDLLKSLSGVTVDGQNILIRQTVHHELVDTNLPIYYNADDLDTFVITTSADPENTISAESVKNTINLNVQDGGYF